MKKKIIGILLAVTLTVSQAGIVVYAEDVTWEDEFTQMDEADESETPEADVTWDGESEISETEDDEEQVEVTEEDTEAGEEETNTETEESPVSEEESLFSDGVGELFSSGDTIVYDADEMEPFKSRTLKLQVLVDFFFINLYHRFYLFPVLIFADDLHAFHGIPLIPLLSWPCE